GRLLRDAPLRTKREIVPRTSTKQNTTVFALPNSIRANYEQASKTQSEHSFLPELCILSLSGLARTVSCQFFISGYGSLWWRRQRFDGAVPLACRSAAFRGVS